MDANTIDPMFKLPWNHQHLVNVSSLFSDRIIYIDAIVCSNEIIPKDASKRKK